MENINSNIVIMGPIGVGKSSVAQELAKQLCLPRIGLDEQRKRIYKQTSFSSEELERQYSLNGIMRWYIYQKPYELLSVGVILSEYSNTVIDFGGGQSVYDDDEKQATEFLHLMEPVKNSILLMPYKDADKSISFLSKRINKDELKLNEIFVRSETSKLAAKHIIYTEMKTIKQIVDEIRSFIK